jgi:hypothetical protein
MVTPSPSTEQRLSQNSYHCKVQATPGAHGTTRCHCQPCSSWSSICRETALTYGITLQEQTPAHCSEDITTSRSSYSSKSCLCSQHLLVPPESAFLPISPLHLASMLFMVISLSPVWSYISAHPLSRQSFPVFEKASLFKLEGESLHSFVL